MQKLIEINWWYLEIQVSKMTLKAILTENLKFHGYPYSPYTNPR